MLAGIAVTLLAQVGIGARRVGGCGVAHGRAAELAAPQGRDTRRDTRRRARRAARGVEGRAVTAFAARAGRTRRRWANGGEGPRVGGCADCCWVRVAGCHQAAPGAVAHRAGPGGQPAGRGLRPDDHARARRCAPSAVSHRWVYAVTADAVVVYTTANAGRGCRRLRATAGSTRRSYGTVADRSRR